MGWSDDILDDYKKKKKQEKWSEKVLKREDRKVEAPSGITVKEVEEIAPTKSTRGGGGGGHGKSTGIAPVKEEEERTWFKGGAFSDGYDFGDITKTILGTTGDVVVGATKGIGNLAEGLVDLGTYGVAGVGSMFGADTSEIKEFAKKELVNDFLEPAEQFVDRGSVLGDKADAIPQGLGYVGGIILTGGLGASAGLGSAGVTALTTSTIGASAMGSGMGEAYKGGATDEEAVTYGIISGLAEAGSELIFGGLGKTVKATGLSYGLISADDMLAKKISSKFSSQLAKNFAEFGVKAGAEGLEEVAAGTLQAIGKKVTYMKEEELLQLIEDENLFEQFVTGAVVSGLSQSGYIPGMTEGSLKEANKTGKDFITGFTQNEQTVLDKMVEKEIAAKEKDGTKLTNKEKNKITEELQEDLQNGLIDTTDIESVLGGDTYTKLQNTKTEIEGIQKQVTELENKPNAEITVKEKEQLDSLREKLSTMKTTDIENQLQSEMQSKIGKDNFLQRSYYEKGQKSTAYKYEITEKTSEIAKKAYVTAEKAGANNHIKTRNFVENMVKVGEDTGTNIIFVNNEQLKRHYDKTGAKMIDGYVNKKGELVINLNSPKALNKTVGHEIYHLFEGTEEGNVYRKLLKEYAELKGDYQAKVESMSELYKNVDANLENEVTADLTGDYFFNDLDFVTHLSTKQPNIFKKAYDYIKHLAKQLTAGSKEARQLEKVKYALEQAYRSVKKKAQTTQDTKYSVSEDSKGNKLNPNVMKWAEKSKARDENGNLKAVYHGTATGEFTIFDKSKGRVEGDFGSGFYFTDNEVDVETNYEDGGDDFDVKVYMLADQIVAEENIDYDEAEEKARKQLYKGGHKFEVYLNIENPAIVGETILLNPDDLTKDTIESIVSDVENNVDVNSVDGLADVLFKAYNNGGIGIEELKKAINDLYLKTGNGELAGNEITRQIIESLGYDGIIDSTVSTKWRNMEMEEGTTHYIAFKPNQIKSITNENPTDNPDIRYSLSEDISKRYDEIKEQRYELRRQLFELRRERDDIVDTIPNYRRFQQYAELEDINKRIDDNINLSKKLYAEQEEIEAKLDEIKEQEKKERIAKEEAEATPHKLAQNKIIQETNPMLDDYHTGIRSVGDIKTWQEAMEEAEQRNEGYNWGDFSKEDGEKALKKGTIRVYSSYAIKNGVFVSTSYQQALMYAGGDARKVHSREVALDSVAWIDVDEGQYAKVKKYSLSDPNNTAPRQRGQIYSEDVKIQEVIGDVKQTINNLFDRVNNIYDRVTVNEKDFAPVNEASLPGLEQQFTESLNTLTDDLAPVSQEPDVVEEDTLDSKGVTLDTKELTEEMLELGVTKKNNTKELKKAAEELNAIVSEGLTDNATLDTFVDSLGARLLVEHDPYEYDEAVQQARDYIRNTRLYVGEAAKKGIGQWNEFLRANMGKMKLTNDSKATPVDVAYQEMQEMFGTALFPEDVYNPADQLEHLSDILGAAKNNIPLYEYVENEYGPRAWEEIKQSFIDNIKSKVSEAAKTLEAENYTNYYASIPIAENTKLKEEYLAIEPAPTPPTKEPKMIRVKPDSEEQQKVAKILTEEPKTESERNGRKWAIFKANVFDKGIVFEDVSLKHKNRELMGKWDYTLTSEARGQNAIGQGYYEYDPYTKRVEQVSKSLNDIKAEVENSGLATEFIEYVYHKHNIDRMSLERKAQEKVRTILRTSDYSHEELMTLANKRITEKTSQEDAKAIEFAKEYKALFDIKNKPVFGESITAKESQEVVNKYELTHPEFMDFAQDIYNYTNAERQELVKGGVISQETADLWQQMYPHYVPIRRAGHEGSAINVPLDTGRTGVNAPIKRATGGNKDILPLFDTLALRTLQTHRATAKNSFGVELMNTIGTKINSQNTDIDGVIDGIETQEELLQEGKNGEKPTFTVFEDGVKHTFEITKDMYDALKPLSESSLLSKTITPLNVASNLHRGVLTEYNPVFMLTNAIKDSQDILINSQHAAKTYAKIPEAFTQLVKKGYWYQEYMNYGGEQNSYFDSHDNTFKTENKGIKKLLDLPPLSTISKLNNYIERVPRLAEYIASRESGRSIEVAMLDAARVTTNFKAGGNLTKFLNRNGATFLNASVQGLMQQVRNVREAKANGARGWMNLATKFAIAGVPAVILNALLWDDDEEYEELSDYIKQNYYIVDKTDEGKFIRIPKGRTLAVIQDAVQQISDVATGNDEADFKSFIELALTNLAPNNPIENNIASPIIQAATNTTWYGDDLVPTRLQDLPAAEQFDESTDAFSKWLGEKIDVSPIKINYLLDQFTGGVGDVILPMMTPKAESGADTLGEKLLAPLNNKFTADAVLNNQNVADFYDKSDELTTEAKKSGATDEDVLRNKYMNSVMGEMNELYKEKRAVQNTSMTNSEKYEEVRSIQSEINKLAKEGLRNYNDVELKSNYSTVGDREYYKNPKGEWEKVDSKEVKALKELGMTSKDKNRYFKAKNEISEIKNSDAEDKKSSIIQAIRNANLNDEQTAYLYDKSYASTEKLDVVVKTGIGMDAYLDLEMQGFTADKDDEGKTISGSKKDKVFDYINTLDIDFEQRVILAKMYYPSYDEYNYEIIEYLNNNDSLSYQDTVDILKTLKFEVDEDGNIFWD